MQKRMHIFYFIQKYHKKSAIKLKPFVLIKILIYFLVFYQMTKVYTNYVINKLRTINSFYVRSLPAVVATVLVRTPLRTILA